MKSGNCASPLDVKLNKEGPTKANNTHKPPVIPKANFNDFMSSFLPIFSDNISFKAKKPNKGIVSSAMTKIIETERNLLYPGT